MQRKEGILKSVTPTEFRIRLTSGETVRVNKSRRGVPIEIGHGNQFIYPHRIIGLDTWIELAEPRTQEPVSCQIKDANPPQVHAWCTEGEIDVLAQDISRRGPWDFGSNTADLGTVTATHIWIALLRHLIIRRELQDPAAVTLITERIQDAVNGKIIRSHDPVLSRTHLNRGVTPGDLIAWVLEITRPKKTIATAWQQAAAKQ